MAADTDDDRPSWSMFVWMGLLCGVTLGAVLVLVLRDRRNQQGQLGGPINIWNVGSGEQHPMLQGMPASYNMLPEGRSREWSAPDPKFKTKTGTLTVSASSSQRLLRAVGGRRWTAQVRVVGPPGAYGIFGTDPDNGVGETAGAASFVVPAGGEPQNVDLDPGDYLFARGSVAGTVVSFTARQLA